MVAAHVTWEAIRAEAAPCYQCGTCSGACPVANEMDVSPRKMMRLIQADLHDEVARSDAPWVCASCLSCTVRCPRQIPIADVMGMIRTLAIAEGVNPRTDGIYNKSFVQIVKEWGRMFEAELVLRHHLQINPFKLLGQAPVGLKMMRKGKLAFTPERSQGRQEVQEILARVAQRKAEK
ncbi:MAG: 4Fe-4S dicluster domain-containing protein [Chloroflexota bacterium]